jgi:hypothetical protein
MFRDGGGPARGGPRSSRQSTLRHIDCSTAGRYRQSDFTVEAAMREAQAVPQPLEAASPFELRVDLGKHVPETDARRALATGDMGFLHSFTTGATVDGPGVRVVAWTSGCMWRCRYCHNPDTWSMGNGMPVTVARAAEELRKYKRGLKVMSGGITLSGGEPLMQHRFAAKLFAAARDMGMHTALDTNGYYGDRLSDAELETVNLVLLDIKTWDSARHRQLTGMDGAPRALVTIPTRHVRMGAGFVPLHPMKHRTGHLDRVCPRTALCHYLNFLGTSTQNQPRISPSAKPTARSRGYRSPSSLRTAGLSSS